MNWANKRVKMIGFAKNINMNINTPLKFECTFINGTITHFTFFLNTKNKLEKFTKYNQRKKL